MIAGVCSGFAMYFGWDIALVRIALVVITCITGGCGLLFYLAAWVLLPEEPYFLHQPGDQSSTA
jgi:phage shock protein C